MKQFAEFIVRSAMIAAIAAALLEASLLLSWLGAAIAALWILRFGINTALPVFAAALLGSTGWAIQGELGPISNLLGTVGLAIVLRNTRSWSMTLLLLPLVLVAFYAALMVLASGYIDGLHQLLAHMFEAFKQDLIGQLKTSGTSQGQIDEVQAWPVPDKWAMLGWFATMQAGTTILSLLIARWWQALVFNPGGFATEMAGLRFYSSHALVLLASAVLAVWRFDGNWWSLSWLGLCLMPLGFVGLVLMHSLMNTRSAAVFWKVLFYGLVVVWFPLSIAVLALIAVFDSFANLRARFTKR